MTYFFKCKWPKTRLTNKCKEYMLFYPTFRETLRFFIRLLQSMAFGSWYVATYSLISLAFSHLHLRLLLITSFTRMLCFFSAMFCRCLQVWISISLDECFDAENVLTCENQRSKGHCGDEEVAHVCSLTCMTFSCMQVTWPFGLEAARKWGGELRGFLSFARPSLLATCTCVFQIRQTHQVCLQ